MKRNLVAYQVLLFLLVLSGAFLVDAEDKPEFVKKAVETGRGRWEKKDVKKYFDPPYMIEIEVIFRKLESAQVIGEYKIINIIERNAKRPYVISFELSREGATVFHVDIYDYRAWNMACDSLIADSIDRSQVLSAIPDNYAITKSDGMYTVTCRTVNPAKCFFDLRERLVILVQSDFGQEGRVKSEEYKIGQIDQMVQRLVSLVEAKDDEAKRPSTKGEGQEKK